MSALTENFDDLAPWEYGENGYFGSPSSLPFYNGGSVAPCRIPLGSQTSPELERLDAEAAEREAARSLSEG